MLAASLALVKNYVYRSVLFGLTILSLRRRTSSETFHSFWTISGGSIRVLTKK